MHSLEVFACHTLVWSLFYCCLPSVFSYDTSPFVSFYRGRHEKSRLLSYSCTAQSAYDTAYSAATANCPHYFIFINIWGGCPIYYCENLLPKIFQI